MLEVVYYVASSLDGYIAAPDGGLGWLAPFETSGADYGYSAFYDSIDTVLLGSHAYEQALTFGDWPYAGKPAWVFTSRRLNSTRDDVTVTDLGPDEVLAKIEAQGARRVWLVGGGSLAGSFQAAGHIAEYIVSVIPIILGSGIPVLGACGREQRLHLVQTTEYPDGVLQLRYQPVA
jgi:dihydrofolate reductase